MITRLILRSAESRLAPKNAAPQQSLTVAEIEADANARMLQSAPSPAQPVDSENEQISKKAEIDYSDGFGLFLINRLTGFVQELTYHAAQCNGLFELENTSFRDGAGITQKWKCTCNKTFVHKNCN